MGKRLDEERQERLQPKRIDFAIAELRGAGYDIIYNDGTEIRFEYKGNVIKVWPYSGWFSGKGIKDGRGIYNLLNQIGSGPKKNHINNSEDFHGFM